MISFKRRLLKPLVKCYSSFGAVVKDVGLNISALLEEHLKCTVDVNHKAKLYTDKDIYKATLPRRMFQGIPLKLYNMENYCVHETDLMSHVDFVSSYPVDSNANARASMKYLCSVSGTGKTASVLPAFLISNTNPLKSKRLTHYLYIAFENNESKSFIPFDGLSLSTSITDNENLGAAYMLACVRELVDRPGDHEHRCPYKVHLDSASVPHAGASHKALGDFLRDRFGNDCNVLIHVDEHIKMVNRELYGDQGASFSRGALSVLCGHVSALSVVTFIDPPIEIKAGGYPEICRIPGPVPCLDVVAITRCFPQLSLSRFNRGNLNGIQRRKLATLQFCLSLKVSSILSLLHPDNNHPRNYGPQFLIDFKAKADIQDMDQALDECIAFCKDSMEIDDTKEVKDACYMLVGQSQENVENIYKKVSDLVVLPNGKLSLTFSCLYSASDPKFTIFSAAAARFRYVVNAPCSDMLASTPLEAAYTWSLCCNIVVENGVLNLLGRRFIIASRAARLKVDSGRIFPGGDSDNFSLLNQVKKETIYYAREKDGEATHPLADVFFRTLKGELVLVDITGSLLDDSAIKKQDKLISWIKQSAVDIQDEVVGVVLAPGVVGKSTVKNGVMVLRGKDARKLLGGLDQVFRWMVRNNA